MKEKKNFSDLFEVNTDNKLKIDSNNLQSIIEKANSQEHWTNGKKSEKGWDDYNAPFPD